MNAIEVVAELELCIQKLSKKKDEFVIQREYEEAAKLQEDMSAIEAAKGSVLRTARFE